MVVSQLMAEPVLAGPFEQDPPVGSNRDDFLPWAETADRLHERIDEAL
jgi:hypothetical protein